jgi:hypothetical protein
MLKKCSVLLMALIVSLLVMGMGKPAAAEGVPRISKEELKARLGRSDLVVIDVRAAKDWAESGEKIAGAVREEPASPEKWAGSYPKEKTLVLYCA